MNLSEIKKACRYLGMYDFKSKLCLLNDLYDKIQDFTDIGDTFEEKGRKIYADNSHIFGYFYVYEKEQSKQWIEDYGNAISIELMQFPVINFEGIECYAIAENCYINRSIILVISAYAEALQTTTKIYKNEQMIFAEIVKTERVFVISCIDKLKEKAK